MTSICPLDIVNQPDLHCWDVMLNRIQFGKSSPTKLQVDRHKMTCYYNINTTRNKNIEADWCFFFKTCFDFWFSEWGKRKWQGKGNDQLLFQTSNHGISRSSRHMPSAIRVTKISYLKEFLSGQQLYVDLRFSSYHE